MYVSVTDLDGAVSSSLVNEVVRFHHTCVCVCVYVLYYVILSEMHVFCAIQPLRTPIRISFDIFPTRSYACYMK